MPDSPPIVPAIAPPNGNPMRVDSKKEYGSFRDSLRAPIHRWFAYPAGYSHKFVDAKIAEYGLDGHSTVADPFLGTGTTSLAAKMAGVNSIGVEAHEFVHWVARTKMFFDYDIAALSNSIRELASRAESLAENVKLPDEWPPLVYKCFDGDNLNQLAALREAIIESDLDSHARDFLKLALTATLRVVTTAGAGWPYIAPSKYHAKKVKRRALGEFQARCHLMLSDIQQAKALPTARSTHKVILGDARKLASYADGESVDLIVTSPPYLNNYDYADRTRLETYFWGIYQSWADITSGVRDRLMMAATTQVRMTAMSGVRECPGIRQADESVHKDLAEIIGRLSDMRAVKSGKKTYDYVVAGYFEDMLQALVGARDVLKPGGHFALVLGDSAPYGVHIPTERIVGRLAVAVGFSSYEIEQIRTRGGKWGHNPQRHKVPLRESVLTISKG